MQARLAPARLESIQSCVARFLARSARVSGPVSQAPRPHGGSFPVSSLGAAPYETIPLVDEVPGYSFLLAVPSPTKSVRRLFPCPFSVAGPQFSPEWSMYGVICHRQMITTDASLLGWGAVFEGRMAYGVWSGKYLTWHINGLELRAVHLALTHFLPFLTHSRVIVRTDNMAVVSHINCQGGSWSCTLKRHARQLLL